MGRNINILAVQIVLFLINIIRLLISTPMIEINTVFFSILVTALSTTVFFLYFENVIELKRQFLRISYLFILGFLVVHFQVYVDYVLGNYSNFRRDYFLYNNVVNKTSIISSLGLNAFYIGYLLRLIKGEVKINYGAENLRFDYKSSAYFIIGFIIVCFVSFLYFVDTSYFSGNYGEIDIVGPAHLSQTYFYFGIVAYVVIYSLHRMRLGIQISFRGFIFSMNKVFLAILIIYISLVLLSGDRGPIMQLSLIIIGAYSFSQFKKIKARVIVTGIVLGAAVITVLGQIRSFKDGESFLARYEMAKEAAEKYESNFSFSPITHELAISVRTVHAAVDLADNEGYKMGLVQLNQIFAIMPGFGTILRGITGLETKDLASADILTHYILGDDPSHGLGTSCLADIYIDFGVIGVVSGMLAFGYFIRVLESTSSGRRTITIMSWIVLLVFLSKALYLGRSSITILFRECIAIYVIVTVAILLKRR